MFDELAIQGYQQTVRHVIFNIYDTLVDKYLEGIFIYIIEKKKKKKLFEYNNDFLFIL